jgi:hypothetical protein
MLFAGEMPRELDEKVSALETFSITDPLAASVAITRLKKYLSAETYKISLSDLVSNETERAGSVLIVR